MTVAGKHRFPAAAGNAASGLPGRRARSGPGDSAPLRSWFILLVLIVATLFGAVDRQILVVLTEAIKKELMLTDSHIGIIQGFGPGLLAAPGVIYLGRLSDRMPRQVVLGLSILIWSLATAACGIADSFGELVLASVAIGLGEAALAPIIYSILPDIFPGRSRLTANMVYYGAATIGGGFGFAFSGAMVSLVGAYGATLPVWLSEFSTWRLAFFAAALPGLPLALVVMSLGTIPRTNIPSAEPSHSSIMGYLKLHWRASAALVATMFCYGMAAYTLYVWTPVYIIRVLGASAAQVGYAFGMVLTSSAVLGMIIGTVALRRLSLESALGMIAPLRIFQLGLLVAAIPLLVLLFVNQPWHAYVLIGITLACITAATSMVPTLLQDLSPAQIRGRLMSVVTILFLVATGMGPIIVGFISDMLSKDPRSLLYAIVGIATPTLLMAGIILCMSEKSFRWTLSQLSGSGPTA